MSQAMTGHMCYSFAKYENVSLLKIHAITVDRG